jgi:hypothetical protein
MDEGRLQVAQDARGRRGRGRVQRRADGHADGLRVEVAVVVRVHAVHGNQQSGRRAALRPKKARSWLAFYTSLGMNINTKKKNISRYVFSYQGMNIYTDSNLHKNKILYTFMKFCT